MLNLHTYGLAEYDWNEIDNGKYVCICSDELVSTVFRKGYGWQIIINREGVGHIVTGEVFETSDAAMERAGDVLDGADCTLVKMKLKDETTIWKQQKTISNGSPTYGRKYQGTGVSVKKAKSGSWFYLPHGSAIQGWYESAEMAMHAFDSLHT